MAARIDPGRFFAWGWWRRGKKSFEGIFLPEKTFSSFAKVCQVCQLLFHLAGKRPISRQVGRKLRRLTWRKPVVAGNANLQFVDFCFIGYLCENGCYAYSK